MPAPLNLLFLRQPGGNSREIFNDLIRGMAQAGHAVTVVDLADLWRANNSDPASRPRRNAEFTLQLAAAVRTHRFDATFGFWANLLTCVAPVIMDGRARDPFEAIGVPHVMYWLDAPHWAHGGELVASLHAPVFRDPHVAHVVNNDAIAREMTSVFGFGPTSAVPYGVNADVFTPRPPTARYQLVINLGPGDPAPTPSMLAALSSDDPPMDELRRQVADAARPEVQALLGPIGGGAIELGMALLDSQLADSHRPLLDRLGSLGERFPGAAERILESPTRWVQLSSLVRSVRGWERAFVACWMARRFSTAIVGDFSVAWPCEAARLGAVAQEDLAAAYAQAPVALSVMRWQDDQGVNIKPLEITASGVACVTGQRAGLSSLFEIGREVRAFDSPAEASATVRLLLDSPGVRSDLAAAGLDRTRRNHTWRSRAEALADVVRRARERLDARRAA